MRRWSRSRGGWGKTMSPSWTPRTLSYEEGERCLGHEQQIDGLLLGAGDMLEEANDLGRTQFARMASLVKEDEAKGPLHAAFGRFGSPVVSRRGLADEVEEAGRLACRCGRHGDPSGIG